MDTYHSRNLHPSRTPPAAKKRSKTLVIFLKIYTLARNMTTIDAISRWATEHDDPTKTLFTEGGRAFSPNIIAEEVETGTELGMSLFIGMTAYLERTIVDPTRQSVMRIAERGQA